MKKSESVIEVIKDESAPANKDWAILTGQEQHRHPDCFLHKETGIKYSWLSGGMCWPVLAEGKEGCTVVVGSSLDEEPSFTILDAGFSMTPRGLIQECVRLRDKWDGGSSTLFGSFAGPDELYRQMQAETNNDLDPTFCDPFPKLAVTKVFRKV